MLRISIRNKSMIIRMSIDQEEGEMPVNQKVKKIPQIGSNRY